MHVVECRGLDRVGRAGPPPRRHATRSSRRHPCGRFRPTAPPGRRAPWRSSWMPRRPGRRSRSPCSLQRPAPARTPPYADRESYAASRPGCGRWRRRGPSRWPRGSRSRQSSGGWSATYQQLAPALRRLRRRREGGVEGVETSEVPRSGCHIGRSIIDLSPASGHRAGHTPNVRIPGRPYRIATGVPRMLSTRCLGITRAAGAAGRRPAASGPRRRRAGGGRAPARRTARPTRRTTAAAMRW